MSTQNDSTLTDASSTPDSRVGSSDSSASDLIDALDMMRDEFQRIVACPGCNAEIEDIANRAQLKLIQHVPVIVQRDRAEAAAMKLRVENRELRAALTACHSAMLGKVNPKHPAWGVLFAAQDSSPNNRDEARR